MQEKHIQELEGQTITDFEWSDQEAFITTEKARYRMYHEQDCCESVGIEAVEGDTANILNTPVTKAEEIISHDWPGYEESATLTNFRLTTKDGSVIIKWVGSSNGYYSESVLFCELEEKP